MSKAPDYFRFAMCIGAIYADDTIDLVDLINL